MKTLALSIIIITGMALTAVFSPFERRSPEPHLDAPHACKGYESVSDGFGSLVDTTEWECY